MLRLNEVTRQLGLGRRLPTRVLGQSYREALEQLGERHSKARKARP